MAVILVKIGVSRLNTSYTNKMHFRDPPIQKNRIFKTPPIQKIAFSTPPSYKKSYLRDTPMQQFFPFPNKKMAFSRPAPPYTKE